MSRSAEPHWIYVTPEGRAAPFYIISFDKKEPCKAPRRRAAVLKELSTGKYTDVFVFSHGWNNDWKTASERYDAFIRGFSGLREELELEMPAEFWPVGILVCENQPLDAVGPRYAPPRI